MSRDIKKKQRKLQKQRAKKKAEKKAIARQTSLGKRGEFEMAARHPILHACEFAPEQDEGITNLLLSRRVGGGNVAFALFLVDYYCLGVKDITAAVVPEGTYTWNIYDKLDEDYARDDMSPADIRKLVEDAVAYARGLGLSPPDEYRKVRPIFGDSDPAESDEEFVFGCEGKPLFINGPYDSQEKIQRILATLRESCGEGNFDYLIGVSGGSLEGWQDELAYDVDESESDESDWR